MASNPVSPLAPAAFPDLPPIDGAEFAAGSAGIKYRDRTDVMLVRLAPGTTIAGAFTRSTTRAASILDCEAKLAAFRSSPEGAALVVNSGNANAFTGARGQASVDAVTGAVAAALGVPQGRVFSSSTGVIGEPLPHERITAMLPDLAGKLSAGGIGEAARAIMTTDTFAKGAAAEVQGEGGTIRIAGIAKGSGMIAPDMATMLAFVVTDAAISPRALQALVSLYTRNTFNAVTVDGDRSTNDTLLLFATGASGAPKISRAGEHRLADFRDKLESVLMNLAHQLVRDGEGASKFIKITVTGGRIHLTGCVPTGERRAAIDVVVAEVLPGVAVKNELTVLELSDRSEHELIND